MKILGVIPARYGSTRLEGKPLADICGKPMIVRVWERALMVPSIDSLVVATDDGRIKEAVEKFNGKAVLTRKDHKSGTERAAEVCLAYPDHDVVVNIQGDEPLVDPRIIDQVIQCLINAPEASMSTVARVIKDESDYHNPNVVKLVMGSGGRVLYFSRSLIPYPRNAEGFQAYEHIGIYCYRRDLLLKLSGMEETPLEHAESLEQLRLLENGYQIQAVVTEYGEDSLSVDTAADLEKVREIVARLENSRR
ncbi:MAG: 3-deoxy-manno-octulosonate cytidylyltransferase [Bacillota bacterium]